MTVLTLQAPKYLVKFKIILMSLLALSSLLEVLCTVTHVEKNVIYPKGHPSVRI